MEYLLFKITKDTKVFRKGQKVWASWSTGALAAMVRGRYKGSGRWVTSWVHWEDPTNKGKSMSGKPDAKWIGLVKVSPTMSDQLRKLRV